MPKQFDLVTLLRVPPLNADAFLKVNRRLPRAGNVGTILDIYTHPCLGYEIECCEPGSYETEWQHAFTQDELRSWFGPSVS